MSDSQFVVWVPIFIIIGLLVVGCAIDTFVKNERATIRNTIITMINELEEKVVVMMFKAQEATKEVIK